MRGLYAVVCLLWALWAIASTVCGWTRLDIFSYQCLWMMFSTAAAITDYICVRLYIEFCKCIVSAEPFGRLPADD